MKLDRKMHLGMEKSNCLGAMRKSMSKPFLLSYPITACHERREIFAFRINNMSKTNEKTSKKETI